jgi:hypothetical protein
MAHFARVIEGSVVQVHVVSNAVITDADGVEHEEWGQQFLAQLHGYQPEELIQCSYNGNFRGVYPGPGFLYDADLDEFVAPVVEAPEE